MKTEVFKLYEDRENVTLTTYVLSDSPEMLKGTSRPGMIICPGGGYMNCSDREAEPIAIKFASMGYHAFVLRYSAYQEGEMTFPDLSKPLAAKENCQYPTQMREIAQSMLIIREHAGEWNVDADRIAVCGFSAGAHNAAMYAANWHTDIISKYFQEAQEKFRPAAVILGYTLSDYVYMKEAVNKQKPMDVDFFRASNTAFLGEAEPSEEMLDAVSPARHVTKNMPPAFLWATAADELVPVQHSIRMAHALADCGIPFEMHIFEEGAHGLSLASQASAESKSQTDLNVAKWADLADCWLQKRFALNLPEKSAFEEMMEKKDIKAVIFDLDGVLVFTDKFHYQAWKKMADGMGIYFDEEINNRLRGVSRMASLEIILERYKGEPLSLQKKEELAEQKNETYKELLKTMTPEDVSKEVRDTLTELKKRGYEIALGSSSKNAKFILQQVGLLDAFDAISDGTNIAHSKPDPEVFVKGAEFLGRNPAECLVVEDAEAGIDAGIAGGMKTAAIGDAVKCQKADFVLENFSDLLKILM